MIRSDRQITGFLAIVIVLIALMLLYIFAKAEKVLAASYVDTLKTVADSSDGSWRGDEVQFPDIRFVGQGGDGDYVDYNQFACSIPASRTIDSAIGWKHGESIAAIVDSILLTTGIEDADYAVLPTSYSNANGKTLHGPIYYNMTATVAAGARHRVVLTSSFAARIASANYAPGDLIQWITKDRTASGIQRQSFYARASTTNDTLTGYIVVYSSDPPASSSGRRNHILRSQADRHFPVWCIREDAL